MSALTFSLKPTLSQNQLGKINCGRLTPNELTGLSLPQIQNLKLSNPHSSKVADYFDVSGTDSSHIIFENSNFQLENIGHKMAFGQITVKSDCGDFLGAKMQGGTIICHGNAGDRLGDKMRRGLILVDGNAGNYCASRMLAGTIGVYGNVGNYVGFAMKRGTIILTKTPTLHATIQDCGTHTLPFLALLHQSFKPLSTKFNSITSQRVLRFAGDIACNGNGEILVLKS